MKCPLERLKNWRLRLDANKTVTVRPKNLVRICSGITIKEFAAEQGVTVPKTTYYAPKWDLLEAKRLKVRLRKGYILPQINQGKICLKSLKSWVVPWKHYTDISAVKNIHVGTTED